AGGASPAAAGVAARQVRTGTVNVNEIFGVSYGSVDSPMGGMKDSGIGRWHGTEAILRFTEAQTVATQRLMPLEPLNLSYATLAAGYGHLVRVLKTLHRR